MRARLRARTTLPGFVPERRLRAPTTLLVQALSTHIRQLVALPDELRESTIRSYRKLCTGCGCSNERELARFLADEKKPRRCPMARLLRVCGQLGIEVKLPDCLSAGKATREVSWFALLEHMRARVAQDGGSARGGLREQEDAERSGSGSPTRAAPARPAPSESVPSSAQVTQHSGRSAGREELACIEGHWATIRARLRGRGIHFPRQLLLGRSTTRPTWLLPAQMSGSPGWLRPLRRLLSRVAVDTLFHSLPEPGPR